MDNEVKTPNGTHWQYVDIYLFTNGEEQTPPRKFHMCVDDLNNWNNTIKNMARSLYEDACSTIELYTMDGVKVLTPMQVTHDTVYVAVPPHDEFIPAGYSDYMLKASRSREKRKSKNNSVIEQNNNIEEKQIEGNEAKSPEVEISAAKNTVQLQPKNSPDDKIFSAATKDQQSDKKILNNKTPASKNNSSLPQSVAKKTYMNNKNVLPKKNLKIHNIQIKTPQIKSGNTNVIAQKYMQHKQVNSKANKSLPENLKTTLSVEKSMASHVKHVLKPEKKIMTKCTTLENTEEKELKVIENNFGDTNIVVSEKDKKISLDINEIHLPAVESDSKLTDNRNITEIDNDQRNSIISRIGKDFKTNGTMTNSINSEILLKVDNMSLPKEVELSNKPIHNSNSKDDLNCCANNKNFINLNLKIEIKKCDDMITAHCDTLYPNKLNCVTEKKSLSNSDRVCIDCTKQQLNIPESDAVNPKIVPVYCACCDCYNLTDMLRKIDEKFVRLEETNYVIFLPSSLYKKKDDRLKLDQEDDTATTQTIGHNIPEKKEFESSSLPTSQILNGSQNVDVSSLKTEANLGQEDKNLDTITDCELCQLNKEMNLQHNNMTMTSETLNNKTLIAKNSDRNVPRFATNSTQTDWSSMLLEARRHENGHYTFHLPSLKVLKNYGY